MSLNTVIAFALLLKKITRKGSMGKKNFRNRMRKSNSNKRDISSCSSSDDEEDEIVVLEYNNDDYNLMNNNNKKSNSSIISPSIKSLQQQKHASLKQPLDINVISTTQKSIGLSPEDDAVKPRNSSTIVTESSLSTTDETVTNDDDETITTTTTKATADVMIRDFAYPVDSPLHFGKSLASVLKNQASTISLSSPDFNGRDARALFDFSPETEYEIGLKTGQSIWVQYRQCPGWLIADVQDETGLIPESYVEFI